MNTDYLLSPTAADVAADVAADAAPNRDELAVLARLADFPAEAPYFFSPAVVRLSEKQYRALTALVHACEQTLRLPAVQARLWELTAPADWVRLAVPTVHGPRGVFMGYDVHLTADGVKLIEINTNAGGGWINLANMAHAARQRAEADTATATAAATATAGQALSLLREWVAMFKQEWRLGQQTDAAGATKALRRVAIVDEAPAAQFLAPEFSLCREVLTAAGMDVLICAPEELLHHDGALLHRDSKQTIDLVYNRLTDFYWQSAETAALKRAFLAGDVVVTPHPGIHALYADKTALTLLSDADALRQLGVDESLIAVLAAAIPRTEAVRADEADAWWAKRKKWFFKPPAGFGSRATYRGDKLTARVFADIMQGNYLAQELVPPSQHEVETAQQGRVLMKADVRAYCYDGRMQLVAARLYQGQTTNFRTPGGGFAPVVLPT